MWTLVTAHLAGRSIRPDPAEWFTSYQSMITHYAAIAQQNRRRGILGGLRTDHHVGLRRSRLVADGHQRNKGAYTRGPLVYAAQGQRIYQRVILGSAQFYWELTPISR